MDPELLGKLFGFLGTLVSLGSNLAGAINLKAPKDSGDTEQSSAAEPLRTFGRRAAAFCSSASQSFKGMTPQGRFGTSVGVSLLFFCSAFIGLGLNQFAAQFLPLINLVAKLIAGLPGIMALNEGQSSSFIVVAALLVLGALIFFLGLALLITEVLFYNATGANVFDGPNTERVPLTKPRMAAGIILDILSLVVLFGIAAVLPKPDSATTLGEALEVARLLIGPLAFGVYVYLIDRFFRWWDTRRAAAAGTVQ
jgi:hypothetical protein